MSNYEYTCHQPPKKNKQILKVPAYSLSLFISFLLQFVTYTHYSHSSQYSKDIHGLKASSLGSSNLFQRLRATLSVSLSLSTSSNTFLKTTLIRVTVFFSGLSDSTRSRVSPAFTCIQETKQKKNHKMYKCVQFGIESRYKRTHQFTFL